MKVNQFGYEAGTLKMNIAKDKRGSQNFFATFWSLTKSHTYEAKVNLLQPSIATDVSIKKLLGMSS
jgi:hypothetical protein